jgi:antitoxin MazE
MAIAILAWTGHGIYIVLTMPRSNSVKARIVAIGNSQGIRIPKPLLQQAGLGGEVELHAETGRIVIAATRRTREGWAEAAAQMHDRGEDAMLDTPAPKFDAEEWQWR